MEESRIYRLDGMELVVPLRYDEKTGKYIEDYREWIENVVLTPAGNAIMFAGEDACERGRKAEAGECLDCGSCVYYKRADEHSWIGACMRSSGRSPDERAEC